MADPKSVTSVKKEISQLINFLKEFETVSEEEFLEVTPFTIGDSEDDRMKRLQHLTEIIVLTVKLIAEFAKRIPFFDTIHEEDRIKLLKANIGLALILRAARKHDEKNKCIDFGNNQAYTRDDFHSAHMEKFGDAIFRFCETISIKKFSNSEYALITAIVIFFEIPLLKDPEKVKEIREYYIQLLKLGALFQPKEENYLDGNLLSLLAKLRAFRDPDLPEFFVAVLCKKGPSVIANIWNAVRKKYNSENQESSGLR